MGSTKTPRRHLSPMVGTQLTTQQHPLIVSPDYVLAVSAVLGFDVFFCKNTPLLPHQGRTSVTVGARVLARGRQRKMDTPKLVEGREGGAGAAAGGATPPPPTLTCCHGLPATPFCLLRAALPTSPPWACDCPSTGCQRFRCVRPSCAVAGDRAGLRVAGTGTGQSDVFTVGMVPVVA